MNLPELALNVEQYKKLKLSELEELYSQHVIPQITQSLQTAVTLMEWTPAEGENPEAHQLATSLAREVLSLFTAHYLNEQKLRANLPEERIELQEAEKLLRLTQALVKEHSEIRDMFNHIALLSDQCILRPGCPALHKLAYARINNIRQDVLRLFFMEEEYLFPRLPALLRQRHRH